MKATVFFDAFAECLVYAALARRHPLKVAAMRQTAINAVVHVHKHVDAGEATGAMFDKLWSDLQTPEPKQ
jgi:hypothetical protein